MTSSLGEEPVGGGQKTTGDDLMTEEHIFFTIYAYKGGRGSQNDFMTRG